MLNLRGSELLVLTAESAATPRYTVLAMMAKVQRDLKREPKFLKSSARNRGGRARSIYTVATLRRPVPLRNPRPKANWAHVFAKGLFAKALIIGSSFFRRTQPRTENQ